jgi:hypothetical protein
VFLSGSTDSSAQESGGGQFWTVSVWLTILSVRLLMHRYRVLPFTTPRRGYSGSAAVPEAGAAQTAFPAPPRDPCRFTGGLSTGYTDESDGVERHRFRLQTIVSRWPRVSPTERGTDNRMADSARLPPGRKPQRFTEGRWLARTAGRFRHRPESFRLAPSIPALLPDVPVDRHWLHTPAVSREVRAECSVRVRTCTGRFRCVYVAIGISPFIRLLLDSVWSRCGSRSP